MNFEINKKMFRFFLVLSLFSSHVMLFSSSSLKINIILHPIYNGAGKEVDLKIIQDELERMGHQVAVYDLMHKDKIKLPKVDINIFLAHINKDFFSKAKLNWFIPNPETCKASLQDLLELDLILCKTQEALRIFTLLSTNVYYLGFTSFDRYNESYLKNYNEYLHAAGKSNFKGSETIYKVWKNNPDLPYLIFSIRGSKKFSKPPSCTNLNLLTEKIPEETFLQLQNECGIHLCPSKVEGYGHYIMSAMSTKAVVVTTNAPPMNEFIKNHKCLVKYCTKRKVNYGEMYFVDETDLLIKIKDLQQLSLSDLQEIGNMNRVEFIRRDVEFKSNFRELINATSAILQLDAENIEEKN